MCVFGKSGCKVKVMGEGKQPEHLEGLEGGS